MFTVSTLKCLFFKGRHINPFEGEINKQKGDYYGTYKESVFDKR